MKQIEVTILGQNYVLGCPEGGERALLEAVRSVDSEMTAIRDSGKVRARERMAVLAALNLAYRLAELPAASAASPLPDTLSDATPGSVDLRALIDRIDETLARDGQLL